MSILPFDITPYLRYVYTGLFCIAVICFIIGKIVDARDNKKDREEKARAAAQIETETENKG